MPPTSGQLVAPLITGFVIAPAWMPHFERIALYWPPAINFFIAACTGFCMPLFFGIAMPYGASPYGWPETLNWPLDCLAMYAATGESAMPTSARPLDSARFAPFWSGNTSTVTLHFFACAWASVCWVVPFSTATLWLQRSASVLIVGPPWAFV